VPLFCFDFKINSAVVTLPYVVCCKNVANVKIINPDKMKSVCVDIRVWTKRSRTSDGIALFEV